jgi:hypothetical protein
MGLSTGDIKVCSPLNTLAINSPRAIAEIRVTKIRRRIKIKS